MNSRTIYYHMTKEGYELICPEDGHVKFEETVGNYTVLGVLTTDWQGYRVWIFHNLTLYMVAVSVNDWPFADALYYLEQDFNREAQNLK